jgi:hypothetical protein
MNARNVLVVLTPAGAEARDGWLRANLRVIARLPPRLLVVEVDDHAMAELGRDPGVARVLERDASPAGLEGLRPEEQLFVDGWQLGSARESQPRTGEGLSWDAPGFQPPDLPPKPRA